MREIIKKHGTLKEGQRFLDVQLIRRAKTRPMSSLVHPMAMRAEIATVMGRELAPVSVTTRHIEKPIGIERREFRWMEPDGNGGLREKK